MEQQQEQELEMLFGVFRAELLRFLLARTGDASEAEDILQDLWVKARQPGGAPVTHGRAYLYRMAQNLVIDRRREQQRRMQRERLWSDNRSDFSGGGESRDLSQNAEDAMLEREEAARLASAMTTLPEGARRAFELHKLEGLNHADVAVRLGISKSGVEKHMAVAMKYLRRAMRD
jgi:RNA polymerase sigma-70 factor (ECF subfamily)